MLKLLLKYFKPHRKLFVADMICAVLAALVDLAFPLVSRHAMYDMLPERAYQAFFILMLIVGISYIIRAVCYYVMTYWGHTFGIRVEADIRSDMFRHLQSLDFEFYDHNRTGTLMNRLTGDLFEITELSHHGPEDVVIATLTILGALFFMFRFNVKLALVVSILIPIFVIIVHGRHNLLHQSLIIILHLHIVNLIILSLHA